MSTQFSNPLDGVAWRRYGHRLGCASNSAEIVRARLMGRVPPPEAADWIGWRELARQLGEPERTVESWIARARKSSAADRQSTEPEAA